MVLTTNPAGANIAGAVLDPNLSFWVPPSGNYVVNTSSVGDLATGSTRVLSSGPVTLEGGFVMPGLTSTGFASSALGSTVTLPVSVGAGGNRNTGVAFLSLEAAQTTLLLTLRDASGAVIPGGTGSVTLDANGQRSAFVTQLLPGVTLAEFTGTLTVEVTARSHPGGLGVRPCAAIRQRDGHPGDGHCGSLTRRGIPAFFQGSRIPDLFCHKCSFLDDGPRGPHLHTDLTANEINIK